MHFKIKILEEKKIYTQNIDINSPPPPPRYNPSPHLYSFAPASSTSHPTPQSQPPCSSWIEIPVEIVAASRHVPKDGGWTQHNGKAEREERKRREPHKGAVFAANTCFVPRYKRWSAALIARFQPTRVKRGYPNA